MAVKTKNKIKIKFYPEGDVYASFYDTISNYVKIQFFANLEKYTNNFQNELTMENLVDIQCDIERDVRKKFVLAGDLLDFGIWGFYFSKNLKSVSINSRSCVPSWYSSDEYADDLTDDDMDIDIEITLPSKLKISKDLFDLDVSMCETYREEECQSYANRYKFKRLKKFSKQPYTNYMSYFARIERE